MSVVHDINPIPLFQYRGFSIQKEAIGEVPKLNFKIEMSIKPEKTRELTYVYINHLDCEVSLNSTASPEFDGNFSQEGPLGTYTINIGKLIQLGKSETIHLTMLLNSPKVDKFLEIRHKKKYLMFLVKISGYCLCYDAEHKLTKQTPIKAYRLMRMTTEGEPSEYIIFDTDDFVKLMKGIKGYTLESIELPIYDFKKQRFPSMTEAVKLLRSAYQNLYAGNELATVRDIRNLFLNYLTVTKSIDTEEGKRPEKFLRNEIKKYIIDKVPDSSKKVYKEVIKGLERDIRSICDVLSKFIHETDDILINVPFHRDLEFFYFSTLSIMIYLAKHLE